MRQRHRVQRTWRTAGAPHVNKKCVCGRIFRAATRPEVNAMFRKHQHDAEEGINVVSAIGADAFSISVAVSADGTVAP